jgi:O-antigen ligase
MIIVLTLFLFYLLAATWCLSTGLREFSAFLLGLLAINALALPTYLLPQLESLPVRQFSILAGAAIGLFIAVFYTEGFSQAVDRLLRNKYLLALSCLVFVVVLQYLRTSEPNYGGRKTVSFLFHSGVPLLWVGVFGRLRRSDVWAFTLGVCLASIGVAVSMLVSSQAFGDMSRRSSLGDAIHPINVARNIGCGLCLIMNMFFFRRLPVWGSITLLVAAGICVISMLMTGSRGPVVAAAIAVAVPLLFVGQRTALFRATVFSAALIGAVWILPALPLGSISFFKSNIAAPLERIVALMENAGENRSDAKRIDRYEVAWQGFIKSKFLGVGTGGFLGLWGGPPPGGIYTDKDYPHNIFLEIAVELGAPGLICFFAMMFFVSERLVKHRLYGDLGDTIPILIGLWIYGFTNSLVSGDLGTNYLLFVAGGILYGGTELHSHNEAGAYLVEYDGSSDTDSDPEDSDEDDDGSLSEDYSKSYSRDY